MIFTAENTLLIGSILLFVSIVVGKTGYRFGFSNIKNVLIEQFGIGGISTVDEDIMKFLS